MPYDVRKVGKRYCVIRRGDASRKAKTIGCHDTKAKAEAQRRAIHANSDEDD